MCGVSRSPSAHSKAVVYRGASGTRDADRHLPMTTDTVAWIASMTKAITTVAALQMVEQGRLALDAPIGDVLPALAQPRVLDGFEEDGTPRLRPARRAITLRHLLTHTSGHTNSVWNADMARYMQGAGVPATGSGLRRALTVPLIADPGERWEYGIGLDWTGQAIETASGQRLDAYFRDHVLGPLGMDDTGVPHRPGATRAPRCHASAPA